MHGPNETDFEDEIAKLLKAAHTELSREGSRKLLTQAIKRCNAWQNGGGGEEAIIFKTNALRDLALEEVAPPTRTQCWRNALDSVRPLVETCPTPAAASTYAEISVDCIQDPFTDLTAADHAKILLNAQQALDTAINEVGDGSDAGVLLARKSSVLRHRALHEVTPDQLRSWLQKSQRCAERAVQLSNSPATYLELGWCEWSLAWHEHTETGYKSRLSNAENHLRQASSALFEPARLALPRFYRLTFRPWDACQHYPSSLSGAKSPRRVLRDSYIYAEAASQLWYNNYPEEEVSRHVSEARALLETAVTAGFATPRHSVAVLLLRSIDGGPPNELRDLPSVLTPDGHISWEEVLDAVADTTSPDLLKLAFALPTHEQSIVWTLLGTLLLKFVDDPSAAEAFYREAVRVNRRNPIALTNLARLLVRKGGTAALKEADRYLGSAAQFSDRRFRWWKVVRDELRARSPQKSRSSQKNRTATVTHASLSAPLPQSLTLKDSRDIAKLFRQAEQMPEQRRGYELERLIYEAANLTVGIAKPSYRIKKTPEIEVQIDGYFECGEEKYRVECRWRAGKATSNDILDLSKNVDVAGVSGLFVSMSGFDGGALDQARMLASEKPILLMDGDEVRAVLNGQINLDAVICQKRLFFNWRSVCYHQVLPSTEVG